MKPSEPQLKEGGNFQLPSIHMMVHDVASTNDALDRFRIDGDVKRQKMPKLEQRKQNSAQPSLPLPSFSDGSKEPPPVASGYERNSLDPFNHRPAPVEPNYNNEINSSYYQYWGKPPFPAVRDPSAPQAQHLHHHHHQQQPMHHSQHPHLPHPSEHLHSQPQQQQLPPPHSQYYHSESPAIDNASTGSVDSTNTVPLPAQDDAATGSDAPIRRRTNLPKGVTNTLRQWLHDHVDNPYPSEEDKHQLMRETGLTLVQVSNWFINARRRVLNSSQRKGKYRNIRANSQYSP